MADKTFLLNGGRELDVVTLESADPLLARLLGEAPSRPAVPFLRTMHDDQGRQCLGVFIGSEQVGHLPADTCAGVLPTVQACELSGAVVRVRGDLTSTEHLPGKVKLRLNLADADELLPGPLSEPAGPSVDLLQADSTERRGIAPGAAELLSASLDDTPVFGVSSRGAGFYGSPDDFTATMSPATALETAAGPPLSTGYAEDYPDWPPPRPKPLVSTEPPEPIAPVVPQNPPASPPSPQSVLATRSAWLGATPISAQSAGAGWLNSAAGSSQGPTENSPPPAASESAPSWQDMAERPGAGQGGRLDPEREVVAAWTSSTTDAQTVPSVIPAAGPGNAKTWIFAALGVLVAVAAAFLIWKMEFAPQTYTNDTYGYSFAHPGRWQMEDGTDMFAGFTSQTSGASILSMAAAGYGLGDSTRPEELAGVAVFMFTAGAFGDESQLPMMLQTGYGSAEAASVGISIIEPVSAVTVGGLPGYRTSVSLVEGDFSLTATLCLLSSADSAYMLMTMATTDEWSGARKHFDRFFESFEPGSTVR